MPTPELEITTSRSGEPSLGLRLQNGRKLALCSPYDPRREAERWAAQAAIVPNQVLIVLGLAAGYHLEALQRRLWDSNDVIVLEPLAAVLESMKRFPAVCRIAEAPRWRLVSDTDALWSHYDQIPNACWKDLALLTLPSYVQAFPELVESLREAVARRRIELQIQRSTVLGTAARWQRNLFANLPALHRAAPLSRLFGRLEKVPAVVVAAGPSLEHNAALLRQAHGRALIVATATAARKLSQEDIPYDLVVSVDPHEVNYTTHFAGVDHGRRPLCFDPTLCPQVVENHQGPLGLMRIFPDLVWLERYGPEPFGEVKTAGSVAAVAFDLVRRLGCDPIILIGQDLSFTTGSTHAAGTFAPGFPMSVPAEWLAGDEEGLRRMAALQPSNPWFHSIRRLQVPALDGGTVPTDEKLFATLVWFEREIRACQGRPAVINSTAAGAYLHGAEHLPFEAALDQRCRTDLSDSLEAVHLSLRRPAGFDYRRLLQDLAATRHELSSLERALDGRFGSPELERAAAHFERSKTVLHFLAAPVLVRLFDLKGKQEAGVLSGGEFRRQVAAGFREYLRAGLPMLDWAEQSVETLAQAHT